MNSFTKDYNKIYRLQDKFLAWWVTLNLPFYLTGGTALGRCYLYHRFSDDLDFFINADSNYMKYISELREKITSHFNINIQQSLFSDDFTRIYINEDDVFIKIELVNDVDYRVSNAVKFKYGYIDTPVNILANKLTAIVGRDEPKDIFDIIHLSLNFSFNWIKIFEHAKQKAIINELDIEQRLGSFPLEWLEDVNWLNDKPDIVIYRKHLNQIADDFLLGKNNSLGKNHTPIEMAKPQFSTKLKTEN
jgi:hypothetical protein